MAGRDSKTLKPGKVLPLDELIWSHITRVLEEHGGNVSAAARALGMHRRTLQRKLHRRVPDNGNS